MLATAADPSDALRTAAETARLRRMVDDFWQPIGRILRTLGVRDADIDDALQQVYLVGSSKLSTIEIGKERAYLVQVAVNIAARHRRSRSRSRETPDDGVGESVASPTEVADERLDRERALQRLDRALDRLDEELRTVFVLYEIEELTMAEISTTLEIPAGTVASRLRRAREEFRRAVRQLEPEVTR